MKPPVSLLFRIDDGFQRGSIRPLLHPQREGWFFWSYFVFIFISFLGALEPVALAIGLDDVDTMGEPVE